MSGFSKYNVVNEMIMMGYIMGSRSVSNSTHLNPRKIFKHMIHKKIADVHAYGWI